MGNEPLTDQQLYDEMIEKAKKEIRIIEIRTKFWQRQEMTAKGGKEMIMAMLREQVAQMTLQTSWLSYLEEKRPRK